MLLFETHIHDTNEGLARDFLRQRMRENVTFRRLTQEKLIAYEIMPNEELTRKV
jgi:hypothetical protein